LTPLAEVALGGLLGAPARLLTDRLVSRRVRAAFPAGTFAINASGALLLGLLAGLHTNDQVSRGVFLVFGTGFCGAYTTFSTFCYETVDLFASRRLGRGLVNLVGSLTLGLLAAAAGLALGLAW